MKMLLHTMRLPLKDPFTIARGTITFQDCLVVELQDQGFVGFGEVTANDFYGHTLEAMTQALQSLTEDHLQQVVDTPPETNWPNLAQQLAGDMFAVSALDMAAQDLWARKAQQSVWQRWGFEWNSGLHSSFTIGIDTTKEMIRKLNAEPGWPIYKIKLGTDHDLAIVQSLREHTDAVFRVDANCGWTVEQTIENSHQLKDLGVQYIEQPLPREANPEDKRAIFQQSALPLIADEDCQRVEDLESCFQHFHGINVKLCKCGGLTPGKQMLEAARAAGKMTMIGCMVESAIGISGAAQLAPLLDFADLDGNNLVRSSPTTGVSVQQGELKNVDGPGTGAKLFVDQLPDYLIR